EPPIKSQPAIQVRRRTDISRVESISGIAAAVIGDQTLQECAFSTSYFDDAAIPDALFYNQGTDKPVNMSAERRGPGLAVLIFGVVGYEVRVESRLESKSARLAYAHDEVAASNGHGGRFAGEQPVLIHGDRPPARELDRIGGSTQGTALFR